MIIRIVKMTFKPEAVGDFMEIFEASKSYIRNFNGCLYLSLLQDKNQPNVLFTYSYWKDEDHLNIYRESDLFKNTWAPTKALFIDKPAAWSVDRIEELL